MNIKSALYQSCLEHVQQRLDKCHQNILQIQESLQSETKSSAGDKHETGRAMIQLEREQLGAQLAQLEAEKASLQKIHPDSQHQIIGHGSVVWTTQNNYFISTSIGKMQKDEQTFYALSINAPMGQLLAGKRVGDKLNFRGQIIEILQIQ